MSKLSPPLAVRGVTSKTWNINGPVDMARRNGIIITNALNELIIPWRGNAIHVHDCVEETLNPLRENMGFNQFTRD